MNFDCYWSTPEGDGKVPAIVLASAVHGVNEDLRGIADELAARGFLAAAPDLFWRSVPGPIARGDDRAAKRESDLAEVLAELRRNPRSNGKAAVIGFCYGGPYAILGPKRLGYDAGISCHGTQMLDFIGELEGTTKPVCILWGDDDHAAPPPVLEAYKAVPARMKNVEVHVFPGVAHGYMMREAGKAFNQKAYDFSLARASAILDGLR